MAGGHSSCMYITITGEYVHVENYQDQEITEELFGVHCLEEISLYVPWPRLLNPFPMGGFLSQPQGGLLVSTGNGPKHVQILEPVEALIALSIDQISNTSGRSRYPCQHVIADQRVFIHKGQGSGIYD